MRRKVGVIALALVLAGLPALVSALQYNAQAQATSTRSAAVPSISVGPTTGNELAQITSLESVESSGGYVEVRSDGALRALAIAPAQGTAVVRLTAGGTGNAAALGLAEVDATSTSTYTLDVEALTSQALVAGPAVGTGEVKPIGRNVVQEGDITWLVQGTDICAVRLDGAYACASVSGPDALTLAYTDRAMVVGAKVYLDANNDQVCVDWRTFDPSFDGSTVTATETSTRTSCHAVGVSGYLSSSWSLAASARPSGLVAVVAFSDYHSSTAEYWAHLLVAWGTATTLTADSRLDRARNACGTSPCDIVADIQGLSDDRAEIVSRAQDNYTRRQFLNANNTFSAETSWAETYDPSLAIADGPDGREAVGRVGSDLVRRDLSTGSTETVASGVTTPVYLQAYGDLFLYVWASGGSLYSRLRHPEVGWLGPARLVAVYDPSTATDTDPGGAPSDIRLADGYPWLGACLYGDGWRPCFVPTPAAVAYQPGGFVVVQADQARAWAKVGGAWAALGPVAATEGDHTYSLSYDGSQACLTVDGSSSCTAASGALSHSTPLALGAGTLAWREASYTEGATTHTALLQYRQGSTLLAAQGADGTLVGQVPASSWSGISWEWTSWQPEQQAVPSAQSTGETGLSVDLPGINPAQTAPESPFLGPLFAIGSTVGLPGGWVGAILALILLPAVAILLWRATFSPLVATLGVVTALWLLTALSPIPLWTAIAGTIGVLSAYLVQRGERLL